MVLLLAGCLNPEYVEARRPAVDVAVTGAETWAGDCSYIRKGDCHTIFVLLTNNNKENDLSTNMHYWSGTTRDGQVYKSPWVTGPDAVAPGAATNVTLDFDIPMESQPLVRIEYEAVGMIKGVKSAVPAYT